MKMPDVNVLIYAHRADATDHATYKRLVIDLCNDHEPFALSPLVLSGFLRIVTQPRFFPNPTPLVEALDFVTTIRAAPATRLIQPGDQHFDIFLELCKKTKATGKLVVDAFHAALAIEFDCHFLSADGDFTRFEGLKHKHPLRD